MQLIVRPNKRTGPAFTIPAVLQDGKVVKPEVKKKAMDVLTIDEMQRVKGTHLEDLCIRVPDGAVPDHAMPTSAVPGAAPSDSPKSQATNVPPGQAAAPAATPGSAAPA